MVRAGAELLELGLGGVLGLRVGERFAGGACVAQVLQRLEQDPLADAMRAHRQAGGVERLLLLDRGFQRVEVSQRLRRT